MCEKNPRPFHLEIGEAVVIACAEPGRQEWGYFQFPRLTRTESGAVCAAWECGRDTIEYDGVLRSAVSEDGGRSWRRTRTSDRLRYPVMKNGKYFGGFVQKGAYPTAVVVVSVRKNCRINRGKIDSERCRILGK